MDITSLCTAIPNSKGLHVLKYFFNQRPIKKPSSETLLRLAEPVLTLNCFSFGDNYYKKISGVAMGTKMGPIILEKFLRDTCVYFSPMHILRTSDAFPLPPPHSMLGINWSTFTPAHYFPPSNIKWGEGVAKEPRICGKK